MEIFGLCMEVMKSYDPERHQRIVDRLAAHREDPSITNMDHIEEATQIIREEGLHEVFYGIISSDKEFRKIIFKES